MPFPASMKKSSYAVIIRVITNPVGEADIEWDGRVEGIYNAGFIL